MKRWMNSALAAAITAALLAGCGPTPIERARVELLSALKDPESAQFRGEKLKGDILCGEVNAKNAMGGYVGYTKFITRPGSVALEGRPLENWDKSKDEPGLSEARTQAATTAWRHVDDEDGRLGKVPPETMKKLQDEAEFGFLWRWHCERV